MQRYSYPLEIQYSRYFIVEIWIIWSLFANTPFGSDYTNINSKSLANESNIVQLRKKITEMDALTFRALVKRKKTTRLLLAKYLTIPHTNSTTSTSITDAFSILIEISGNSEVVILRIVQEESGANTSADLFVFAILQGFPLVWKDTHLFTELRTLIDQTLKVYLEQQALNDQAAAVNSSIIEILRDLSSNGQNEKIIENVDISS